MLRLKLIELMPEECIDDTILYSTGRILCLDTNFSNGFSESKYIVLMDDKEPPLYFFINSMKERRLWDYCVLELNASDYKFLKHTSYLHYHSEVSSLDYIEDRLPTKEEIINVLRANPSRVKGYLKKEHAISMMNGIDDNPNDLTPIVKTRIRDALSIYIN